MAPGTTARAASPARWKSCSYSTGRPSSRPSSRARRDALAECNFEWARGIAAKVASQLPSWWHADDLTGAAFLALLGAARKFDPARRIPFRAYARLAVEGACYSAARRSEYTERAHAELTDDAAVLCAPDESGSGGLPAAVWRLPPDECRVIFLIYEHDLTLDATACRMGITASKASQYHRKALDRLRAILVPRKAA